MRRLRKAALAGVLAGVTVVGFSGSAHADEYYWAPYHTNASGCAGMRAQVGFKQYGDIFYVRDECADGFAVAIDTDYGWTYYHRGGHPTQATINDDLAEGRVFRMRACVEFSVTHSACGAWTTVTA